MQYQTFEKFYYAHGVRRLEEFLQPRAFVFRILPRNAVVHTLDAEGGLFPDESNVFLAQTTKRVLLHNENALVEGNHAAGRSSVRLDKDVAQFFQKHHKFVKFNATLDNAKDELQVVLNNYNLLVPVYRYSASNRLAPFYQWLDPYMTLWRRMDEQAALSARQHFFFYRVPKEVPARSQLMMYAKNDTPAMLKSFQSKDDFFLLDFWRWFDPKYRHLSALGQVKTENLPKANIVFQLEDGRHVVLNMGYLNSWIKGQPNQTDKKTINQRSPEQMSTLFLVFLIRLQKLGMMEEEQLPQEDVEGGDPLEMGQSNNTPAGQQNDDESSENDGMELTQELGPGSRSKKKPNTFSTVLQQKFQKLETKTDSEDSLSIEDMLKAAEEDLQALEDLAERRQSVRGSEDTVELYDPEGGRSADEVEKQVFEAKDPKQRLLEQLDARVAKGGMNAADYRKIVKAVEAQSSMLNPYGGDQTLEEAAKVKPEDLQFKDVDTKLVGDARILDPSMTSSTVEALDRQYIKQVMRKDILSTLLSIQNSGVVILGMETDIQHSVTGTFEIHTLNVKHIDGQSSSLSIRLPVVNEDGTYLANNVKYHLRKQRVD